MKERLSIPPVFLLYFKFLHSTGVLFVPVSLSLVVAEGLELSCLSAHLFLTLPQVGAQQPGLLALP